MLDATQSSQCLSSPLRDLSKPCFLENLTFLVPFKEDSKDLYRQLGSAEKFKKLLGDDENPPASG